METKFDGKRNKRGDWQPAEPIHYAPMFEWPFRPLVFLKWLFGYPGFFLPWGIIYMAVPIIIWRFLTPPLETMKVFEFGWMAFIFMRNLVLILLVAGAWHLWLQVKRAQGTDWKYTDKWLASDNPVFILINTDFFSGAPEKVTLFLIS